MATKKLEKDRAFGKQITLYEIDQNIILEEGETFNLSDFVRFCLRNEKVRESYKKTDGKQF